jgi:tetratricopeptide (TPR) repeat protein
MRGNVEYSAEESSLRGSLEALNEKYFDTNPRKDKQQAETNHPAAFSKTENQSPETGITETIITRKKQNNVIILGTWKKLAVAVVLLGAVVFGTIWYVQTSGKNSDVVITAKKTDTPKKTIEPDTASPVLNSVPNDVVDSDKNKKSQELNEETTTARLTPQLINKERLNSLYLAYFQQDALPQPNQNAPDFDANENYKNGEYKKAITSFNEVIERIESPEFSTRGDEDGINQYLFYAYYYKAQSYMAIDSFAEAIGDLRKALQKSPDNYWKSKVQWYLALTYLKKGQVKWAKALLNEVAKNKNSGEYKQKANQLLSKLMNPNKTNIRRQNGLMAADSLSILKAADLPILIIQLIIFAEIKLVTTFYRPLSATPIEFPAPLNNYKIINSVIVYEQAYKKSTFVFLLCISGFFGTLQNVQGQSSSHDNLRTSLHDSLRTMLSHLEKVSSNEKLKHNIEKVLDVYTGDKMDIFLLNRLLEIDNQLIYEAQPNQPIFLTYAETLLRILEKLPPEKENVYYIAGLNNLAILCLNMGLYDKVLPLYQQALFTTSKVFSKQHPYYTSGLNNLAAFYELIGRYDEALGAYQQVIDILKKAGEEEKPRIAPTLMNLADLHRKMGQPEKALHLLQQALEILKKTKGEKLPEYPICLESLAVSYLKMGQHNEAFHLLQEALIIREKTLTKEHPDYANTLVNLAFFYRSTGREDSALHLYNKALVILKNAVSEEHPDVVNVMNDIGTLYAASGNTAAALSLFIQGNNNTLRHLSRTYSTLSEQENITYLNKKSSQFNFLPSLLYLHDTVRSDAVTQLYQSELILKGMVLENQKAVLSGIRKSGDSIAQHLYEQWRTNKAILGKQLLLSIKKRLPNLDSLGEATNQKEQQLSRNSRVFRNQVQSQRLTAKNVAQKLAKEEAAIEFIRFPFYNKKKTDSVMYAALVLLPQDTVAHFVPLFEEKQLQRLLTRPAVAIEYDAIHHLYGHKTRP